MFTPPPSPLPGPHASFHGPVPPVPSSSPSPPLSPQPSRTPHLILSQPPPKCGTSRTGPGPETSTQAIWDRKRRIAWRTGMMVIIVPLLLVLGTLLTRFPSRSFFLSLLAGPSPSPHIDIATPSDGIGDPVHALHRRQSGTITMPTSTPSGSGIVFPSATPTSPKNPSGDVPTIPSSPVTLPTPFPQAFDTTMSDNFTTNSCKTFFTNMTQTLPFRQCRPFSFLSQTSSAFLQAQSNLTELNIDVWGTCNTDVDADQCAANMGWFESQLQTACSQETREDNQMVLQALAGLQSYSLMRDVACSANKNTSTYCYVEAASSSDPSDLYVYSLPFGIPLPNNTLPSCSGCTSGVMSLLASHVDQTDGLKKTYNAAAKLVSSKCGASFVHTQSAIAASSALPWFGDQPLSGWAVAFTLGAFLMGLL